MSRNLREIPQATTAMEYLYVQTTHNLLKLDLKNYNFDLATVSRESPLKPHILKSYGDEGYPINMGVVKLGSKIYFVGGENSRSVYKYDPSNNSLEKSGPSFNSIKDLANVEEIEGKIYVMQPLKITSLEVLDPCSPNPKWVEVRPPPEFWSYFLFRNKIYFLALEKREILCFEPNTNTWNLDFHMFKDWYVSLSWGKYLPHILIPHFGKMISDDVLIALQKEVDRDLCLSTYFLYAYLYSKEGCLLAYQNLGDIFDGICGEPYHFFVMDQSRICALAVGTHGCFSKKKMGRFGPIYLPYNVLVVSIIRLSRLPNAEQLQAKESHVHPAPSTGPSTGPAVYGPAAATPNEEEFLSSSIEKQYFFSFEDFRFPFVRGAFFA